MSEPIVKVIKANPFGAKNLPSVDEHLLKVAAYARVSTDSEEQEDSFERQVDYYTRFIQSNPNWKLVKVYSDPGISGTRADKRPGFQEMIKDCKSGKINRILVKSLARFARNTVDCLNYIRLLKEIGVSVYFEAQNIDTMTPGGDILLTILAATAEEESRTISKNVKWAYQKKFQKGDFTFDYKHFLGLTRDENHKVVIVEEEAQTIRRIYREYLAGKSLNDIARGLEKDGIKSPWGRDKWYYGTVRSILQNEKYYGAVWMGKTFKPDVLSKKRYKNEGQVESYFVENAIPPIIDKETFDMVQLEMKSREKKKKNNDAFVRYCSRYPFSKMLVCGHCGKYLVRCNNMREKGKRIPSWWCSDRRHGGECRQSGLAEYRIEKAFIQLLNALIKNGGDIKSIVKLGVSSVLLEHSNNRIQEIDEKIDKLQGQMIELHKKRVEGAIEDVEYSIKGGKLANEIDGLKKERDSINDACVSSALATKRIEEVCKVIDDYDSLDNFDGELFKKLIDYVTVNNTKLIFHFKAGFDKTVEL